MVNPVKSEEVVTSEGYSSSSAFSADPAMIEAAQRSVAHVDEPSEDTSTQTDPQLPSDQAGRDAALRVAAPKSSIVSEIQKGTDVYPGTVYTVSKFSEVQEQFIKGDCGIVLTRPGSDRKSKEIARATASELGLDVLIAKIPLNHYLRVSLQGMSHLLNFKNSVVLIEDNHLVSIPFNNNTSQEDFLRVAKRLLYGSVPQKVKPSSCVNIPDSTGRSLMVTNY